MLARPRSPIAGSAPAPSLVVQDRPARPVLAAAEAALSFGLGLGAVLASGSPAASLPPVPPPARVVSAEPPAPYPGSVQGWHAPCASVTSETRPGTVTLAGTEAPRPEPGSSLLARGGVDSPSTTTPASPGIISRQEPPAPYPGAVWQIVALLTAPAPAPPTVTARQEPPLPESGSVLQTHAPCASATPQTQPGVALTARSEAPLSENGSVLAAHGVDLPPPPPPPPPTRFVGAEAPLPEAGRVQARHAPCASVTQTLLSLPAVLARTEPWAPEPGSSWCWRPVVAPVSVTAPGLLARQEFRFPEPGSVQVWVAPYRSAVPQVSPGVGSIARSESPLPENGSTFGARFLVAPAPQPLPPGAQFARTEAPLPEPGFLYAWAAPCLTVTPQTPPGLVLLVQAESPLPESGRVHEAHGGTLAAGVPTPPFPPTTVSPLAQLHVRDTGTYLLFTLRDQSGGLVDVSAASNLLLVIRRADGSIAERTTLLLTDGHDGKVYYLTTAEDLIVPGTYHFQVFVSFPGGLWHSPIYKQKVLPNLE